MAEENPKKKLPFNNNCAELNSIAVSNMPYEFEHPLFCENISCFYEKEKLALEIKNPEANSVDNSKKISLSLTLSLPGSISEDLDIKGENRGNPICSKNKKLAVKIKNPDGDLGVKSSKVSLDLTLSLPSSISEESDLSLSSSLGSNSQVANDGEIFWTEKKKLTLSDVDNRQNRLLISKNLAVNYIIPYFGEHGKRRIYEEKSGLGIILKDYNGDKEVHLLLKQWKTKCYVLSGGWKAQVVDENKLEIGDVIGLKWDNDNGKLLFALLEKNST